MTDYFITVALGFASNALFYIFLLGLTLTLNYLMSKQKKDSTPEITGNDTPETPETQTENTVETTATPDTAGNETADGRP